MTLFRPFVVYLHEERLYIQYKQCLKNEHLHSILVFIIWPRAGSTLSIKKYLETVNDNCNLLPKTFLKTCRHHFSKTILVWPHYQVTASPSASTTSKIFGKLWIVRFQTDMPNIHENYLFQQYTHNSWKGKSFVAPSDGRVYTCSNTAFTILAFGQPVCTFTNSSSTKPSSVKVSLLISADRATVHSVLYI